MQRRPVDHLDVHDFAAYDIKVEHAFLSRKAEAPVAGFKRLLALGRGFGVEALAEVVAAAAVSDEPQIPGTDGELALAVGLEQGRQLGNELGEYFAYQGMLGRHVKTITGFLGGEPRNRSA